MLNNRSIEIITTKEENFTLCVDSKFLHSKYYPVKEAEKFIDNNKEIWENKKNIVIYGLGCGYHIISLLSQVDDICDVYVFDIDEEVIKFVKELGLLEEIENDKRIKLFLGQDNFCNKLEEKLRLVQDVLIYKPSVNTIPEEYSQVKNILKSYELSKIGVERFGEVAKENEKANLKLLEIKLISDFLNKFSLENKPIVIVAAGPSLEKDIKTIFEKRDKILVFAVGRALDILMKNNIVPDMITIIDPVKIVYNQIKDYEDLDIPLCFLSTASRWAVENYKGPKYIFFNKEYEFNKDNIIINTGKSVAVATLDIAIKSKTKNIILCGQDLAFTDNKFHVGDKEQYIKCINNNYKKVQGVNNKLLNTTSGMLEFKRNIENLIEDNPNIQFINSSNGARIRGTVEKDLSKYIYEEL